MYVSAVCGMSQKLISQGQENRMRKSMIELHVAVLIMGATALFAKLIHLPPHDIIALRCLIASLTLFGFCHLTGTRLTIDRRSDLGWIIFLGLLIAVHWVTDARRLPGDLRGTGTGYWQAPDGARFIDLGRCWLLVLVATQKKEILLGKLVCLLFAFIGMRDRCLFCN